MLRFAGGLTSSLQNGDLQRHLAVLILSALLPASLMLFSSGGGGGFTVMLPADLSGTPYEIALTVIIVLVTGLLLTSDSRLKAIVSMGVLSFGVSIIFIIYGVPDVALTTFAIETFNVILIVLVLAHLPKFTKRSHATGRLRDGLITTSTGLFMTLTVLQGHLNRSLIPAQGVLWSDQSARGVWAKCGERHSGRFQGARHARRNHRAGNCGDWRVRPTQVKNRKNGLI